ncbi:DUF445 family protein, partial [Paraburkholderia sp. SIMBA_030]|uniref:DUF445 family protein n=1 Tax=Paraburkholderia sp. SIMBA_030 TaxID=3085773 RepID=UPI003977F81F
ESADAEAPSSDARAWRETFMTLCARLATLAADADLRASLNSHLEDAARAMAPDFSRYLTHHIRDTVRNWDTRETARLIELKIGKDLQEIRVNGTVIGGTIGLGLYLCSHLFDWLR